MEMEVCTEEQRHRIKPLHGKLKQGCWPQSTFTSTHGPKRNHDVWETSQEKRNRRINDRRKYRVRDMPEGFPTERDPAEADASEPGPDEEFADEHSDYEDYSNEDLEKEPTPVNTCSDIRYAKVHPNEFPFVENDTDDEAEEKVWSTPDKLPSNLHGAFFDKYCSDQRRCSAASKKSDRLRKRCARCDNLYW
jgi:hypothetical protein